MKFRFCGRPQPLAASCGSHKTSWKPELTAIEEASHGVGENPAPALPSRQLLRSLDQLAKEAGNAREHARRPAGLGVRTGNSERGLSGMAAPFRDSGKQEGPAGDGLQMPVRLGEPHEQVPAVVDERDEAGHELTAGEIAGGEACPTPLVL